jgi:hypothetical protein
MTTNQYIKLGFIYLAYHWITAACIVYSDRPENIVFIVALHFVLVAAQIGFSVIGLLNQLLNFTRK